MTNTAPSLDSRLISEGVIEVYAGDYQIGMLTWDPTRMTSRWYATYANSDETIACNNRPEALECLRVQHAAVQRFARSLRSIRPASGASKSGQTQVFWDAGYNTALRDIERVTQELVGPAPTGEGYTAITRSTD